MKHLIYIHTSTITKKSYIGQTTMTLSRRFQLHKYDAKNGSNSKFHNAIQKYGEESWISQELCFSSNIDDANYIEKLLIVEYDTKHNGYNLTNGGDSYDRSKVNTIHHNKNKKMSSEQKNKISNSLKIFYENNDNPFKGKKHKEESKRKMGIKGVKHDNWNKMPWEVRCNRNNPKIIKLWKIADVVYDLWINNEKCGNRRLLKIVTENNGLLTENYSRTSFDTLIKWFKKYNNPKNNKKWCDWINLSKT